MKTTLLAASVSIALSLCSLSAAAVNVSAQGRGEALIFPYYSVEAGLSTSFHVHNHTDDAKALMVRFRESRNGRPVMAFHVYLGKRDSWQATVFTPVPTAGAGAPAAVYTADNSCTVPGIRSGALPLPTLPNGERYVPFRNFGYVGNSADGGPTSLARTRSGFIEVIEMGTLVPGSAAATAANMPFPNNCDTLSQAWGPGGYWMADPYTDIAAPTGGLSGSAQLVNVSAGSLATYPATALSNLRTVAQHANPGTEMVSLVSQVQDPETSEVTSSVYAEGGAVSSSWPRARAFEAVSAALSAAAVGNRYVLGPGAATEWVLSFPTKHFHTDPARVSSVVAPFTQRYQANSVVAAQSCESASIHVYGKDGEALGQSTEPGQKPNEVRICGATQVLSFAQDGSPGASLLGSPDVASVNTSVHASGMAELDFGAFASAPALSGERWIGLPVIALALWRVDNVAQFGNFSGSAIHSRKVACSDCE